MAQGMRLTLSGIAAGGAAAYLLSGAVQGMLFEVTPTDTTVFLAVTALLALAGALACYLPARRASRLDAVTALRAE
jgi:ABC-type antimicrobial peptide transport system permease subunit